MGLEDRLHTHAALANSKWEQRVRDPSSLRWGAILGQNLHQFQSLHEWERVREVRAPAAAHAGQAPTYTFFSLPVRQLRIMPAVIEALQGLVNEEKEGSELMIWCQHYKAMTALALGAITRLMERVDANHVRLPRPTARLYSTRASLYRAAFLLRRSVQPCTIGSRQQQLARGQPRCRCPSSRRRRCWRPAATCPCWPRRGRPRLWRSLALYARRWRRAHVPAWWSGWTRCDPLPALFHNRSIHVVTPSAGPCAGGILSGRLHLASAGGHLDGPVCPGPAAGGRGRGERRGPRATAGRVGLPANQRERQSPALVPDHGGQQVRRSGRARRHWAKPTDAVPLHEPVEALRRGVAGGLRGGALRPCGGRRPANPPLPRGPALPKCVQEVFFVLRAVESCHAGQCGALQARVPATRD